MTEDVRDIELEERPTEPIMYSYPDHHGKTGESSSIEVLACTDRAVLLTRFLDGVGAGESELRSHEHLEGFLFVKKGRVAIFTTDDVLVGELGELEGMVIPRGMPYRFSSVSVDEGPAEMFHFAVSDEPMVKSLGEVVGGTS